MAITLYTFSTPNGVKISIALELLKLQYKAVNVDITKGEQKTPEFLKVSLNGRIPAITDTEGPGSTSSAPFSLFESGAILQYLADKYDLLDVGVPDGGNRFIFPHTPTAVKRQYPPQKTPVRVPPHRFFFYSNVHALSLTALFSLHSIRDISPP